VKRCLTGATRSIHVGLSIQQEFDAKLMTIGSSVVERRVTGVVRSIDVGLSIQQEFNTRKMASSRSVVERCPVVAINSVHICVSTKQRLYILALASKGRHKKSFVERCLAGSHALRSSTGSDVRQLRTDDGQTRVGARSFGALQRPYSIPLH